MAWLSDIHGYDEIQLGVGLNLPKSSWNSPAWVLTGSQAHSIWKLRQKVKKRSTLHGWMCRQTLFGAVQSLWAAESREAAAPSH